MPKKTRARRDAPTQIKMVVGGIYYILYLQHDQEEVHREDPNALVYRLSRAERRERDKMNFDQIYAIISGVSK